MLIITALSACSKTVEETGSQIESLEGTQVESVIDVISEPSPRSNEN